MTQPQHYFIKTAVYSVNGDLSDTLARRAFFEATDGFFSDAINIQKENILHILPNGETLRYDGSPEDYISYWVKPDGDKEKHVDHRQRG